MVDQVVHRRDLKPTIARLCGLLMQTPVTPVPENILIVRHR
jgi:acetyl-CoA carboxylase carboxyl transferase subunit beta